MTVLATQFKRNTEQREGYLSISDVVENNFKQYIFNSFIKIKSTQAEPERSFTKWIVYWEDSPIAIEMTVITSVLETGFVKAVVVDKKMHNVSELGAYPARNAKVFGVMVDNKFMLKDGAQKYVMDKVQKRTEQKEVVDQATIDQIKNAWGLK